LCCYTEPAKFGGSLPRDKTYTDNTVAYTP